MSDIDESVLLPEGNAVRSVDRAASLLLALGEAPAEAGVTELARRLALHKSTVSRLLGTLEKRGLVEQDAESGKYRLGMAVIRLGEQAERTLDLRGIAMPELQRLARATRETAALVVLRGEQALTIAQADAPNLGAVSDWSGRLAPGHATASGKVLLAALPERDIARMTRRGLRRHTERTLVDMEPLLEELSRIRRRGFAMAVGELEDGTNAVAAPVHDRRGAIVAAVAIQGPAIRIVPRRMPELAAQARSTATAIEARLGVPAAQKSAGGAAANDG